MREKLIKYLDKAFISLMAINLVLVVLGSAFILSDRVFVKNAETNSYSQQVNKNSMLKKVSPTNHKDVKHAVMLAKTQTDKTAKCL